MGWGGEGTGTGGVTSWEASGEEHSFGEEKEDRARARVVNE